MAGLIVIDSLGFTVELSNVLRDRAAAALHMGRERIMVCFSHTHSAPNAAEEPDYFEMVCRQAGTAVRKDIEASAPRNTGDYAKAGL